MFFNDKPDSGRVGAALAVPDTGIPFALHKCVSHTALVITHTVAIIIALICRAQSSWRLILTPVRWSCQRCSLDHHRQLALLTTCGA